MDFTKLAAVSYNDPDRPGLKLIRVYYQVGANIHESCYDEDNGWFVRTDNIVANHAKPRSPIAATILSQGKKTSIFYLDEGNRLARRTRVTEKAGDKGYWTNGQIAQPDFPILGMSQLTAIRTDNEDENIRVFYQSTDHKVRGIVSYQDNGTWEASDLVLDKTLPGTSLCAISANSEVRLYYQADDKSIKEYYSDPDTEWRSTRVKQWIADAKAPITAIAWNYSTNDFKVRVFTAMSNSLAELVYDKSRGGWSKDALGTMEKVVSSSSPEQLSAAAATALDANGRLTVFYKPSKQIIAQYESVNKRIPLGISTARD